MAYSGLDAKKLLQNVANSQVLSGQPQPIPQDQQQTQQSSQQNTTGLVSTSPQQPSAPVQTNIPKPAPSSGSFTNLQQYVQKNQPGADRLAGAVQQNLQTAAERAKKDIAQTQQKFGTELERGSLQGRDTAVQEALKVAQQAAGGIQTPVTVEDQAAKYKQPIEQLQTQITADQAKMKAMQDAQKQYEGFTKATSAYSKYMPGYEMYAFNRGGPQQMNERYGAEVAKVNEAANRVVAEAQRRSNYVQNQQKFLESDEARQMFLRNIGADTSFYNDWRSGAGQKADPNSDLVTTFGLTAAPKYSDRSKDIASLQKELAKRQEDVALYEGLSKLTPQQQDIPEILRQAAQFEGDVSEDRFKEIINAAYGGPRNLYDIQGYEDALSNTREAERRLGMLSERGIRGDLLDTTFKGQGRDYTSGLRGLDQLLLGTPERLQQLQQTKKDIGSVQGVMSQAENLARLTSSERSDLIDQIKKQARGQVQDVAGARAGQVDQRLSQVIENWEKLPQYFRDAIGKGTGNVNLSDVEAGVLGLGSGEGLYNLVRDVGIDKLIQTRAADREALISKQEQAQLANLQRLAEMGQDYGVQGSGLDFRSQFQDAAKAGSQTAFDALDVANLRKIINEAEQKFRDTAASTKVQGTGVGHDRYKSGFKSRDVWVRRDLSAGLKDVLSKAGYDFNRPLSEQTSNPELLKAVGTLARGEELDISPGAGLEDVVASPGEIGATLGGALGLDRKQSDQLMKALTTAGAANAVDFAASFGKDLPVVGNVLSGLSGAIGGLFGSGAGRAQQTAAANALRQAQQNLQANLQKTLDQQGFRNRIVVDADSPEARARRLQLAQTLAQIDPTNTRTLDDQVVESPFSNTQDMLELAKRINRSYRRS